MARRKFKRKLRKPRKRNTGRKTPRANRQIKRITVSNRA